MCAGPLKLSRRQGCPARLSQFRHRSRVNYCISLNHISPSPFFALPSRHCSILSTSFCSVVWVPACICISFVPDRGLIRWFAFGDLQELGFARICSCCCIKHCRSGEHCPHLRPHVCFHTTHMLTGLGSTISPFCACPVVSSTPYAPDPH